jgi:hypothetical protein
MSFRTAMFLLDTCKEMYVVSGHFLADMLMQQSLAQARLCMSFRTAIFLLDTCREMYVVSGHFPANMLMQQS